MTRARDLADSADKDITGTLTVDAITSSGDISLADSAKSVFGAGSDLQIYHDASASYIDEAGTGSLYIRSNGTQVFITDSTSANHMARFTPSGASTLYYSGATKLATTSGGINVTGTLNVTTVDLGNWTVTESSGVLYFATGGVNKMKLDASGNLTVTGDVTAFGTV